MGGSFHGRVLQLNVRLMMKRYALSDTACACSPVGGDSLAFNAQSLGGAVEPQLSSHRPEPDTDRRQSDVEFSLPSPDRPRFSRSLPWPPRLKRIVVLLKPRAKARLQRPTSALAEQGSRSERLPGRPIPPRLSMTPRPHTLSPNKIWGAREIWENCLLPSDGVREVFPACTHFLDNHAR